MRTEFTELPMASEQKDREIQEIMSRLHIQPGVRTVKVDDPVDYRSLAGSQVVTIAILIAAMTVVACVYLHLGALALLWSSYRRHVLPMRHFLGAMVLGVFFVHFLEIALFAAAITAVVGLGADSDAI